MGRRKHEESDAAGVCDPKVMSLSTSGLVQGSDSGSMFAHEKLFVHLCLPLAALIAI